MSEAVWINGTAIAAMQAEADRMFPLETGGVLLGWRNSQDWVINTAIGPGPDAVHKRFRFRPDHEYRLAQITKRFEDTDGAEVYLGDWHTHPNQNIPKISWLDRWELGRIVAFGSPSIGQALMMILGGQSKAWCAGVWLGELVFPHRSWPLARIDARTPKVFGGSE